MGASSCATPSKPAKPTEQLDFSELLSTPRESNSVRIKPVEKGMMERVLVSPNVVFASSRSSRQPGGASKEEQASNKGVGAFGRPIAKKISTTLLEFLVENGSTPIAPIVASLWNPENFCKSGRSCGPYTWMERTMLYYKFGNSPFQGEAGTRISVENSKHVTSAATSEDSPGEMSGSSESSSRSDGNSSTFDSNHQSVPTTALAVRTLGVSVVETPIYVKETDDGFKVRKRKRIDDEGRCEPFNVSVPFAFFEAEIVDLATGKLLMRVDEKRSIPAPNKMTTEVVTDRYFFSEGNLGMSSSWVPQDIACENIQSKLQETINQIAKETKSTEISGKLVTQGLGELY